MKIKIFQCNNDVKELENKMNSWLLRNEPTIKVKDIKIKPYTNTDMIGYIIYNVKDEKIFKDKLEDFLPSPFSLLS